MAGTHRFVGIGIDNYDSPDLETLEHAVEDVRALHTILERDFDGEPVCDADETAIRMHLKTLVDDPADVLVLLWSGHGKAEGGELLLHTRDARGEVSAVDVVRHAIRSGASQILLVIDSCHSGQAVADATAIARALLAEYPPASERVWFGILVSCQAWEEARDGALGSRIRRLLTEGPRSPVHRDRWLHSERLFGDDLAAALVEDWSEVGQRPQYENAGRRWFMLENPLWDPGAPPRIVEHLIIAARGGGDAHSWFRGRAAEVDRVVDWVHGRTAGIHLVLGSAGTGKTAILGRVLSLANPTERGRLADDGGWAHADPGEHSIAAHVHVRGLTYDRAAELLDAQLTRQPQPVLGRNTHPRNAAELVGALQRVQQGGGQTPVIAIDGLDEARDAAFPLIDQLITPLAAVATVIVSSRPIRRDDTDRDLPDLLNPADILDLDTPGASASRRAAIGEYVVARLSSRSSDMDASRVAEAIVGNTENHSDSFLLVRIQVDQLDKAPLDTSTAGWEDKLAQSIGAAFDFDIAMTDTEDYALPAGHDPATLARTMLTALTWAFGAGFPQDEWLAVAGAMSDTALTIQHLNWVLDQLGRYIVQDGEAGMAVYRLAHQSLADHLRPGYQTGRAPLIDPDAGPVWAALERRYRQLLADGHPAEGARYLWRYAHRHAARAGLDAVQSLRSLAGQHPVLNGQLADADAAIADMFSRFGRSADALAPSEEAVDLLTELSIQEPERIADLGRELTRLGLRYNDLQRFQDGHAATERAVGIYSRLVDDDPAYLPDFAGALNNLGMLLTNLGNPAPALPILEHSATLRAEMAGSNRLYLLNLAGTLINIGRCHGELGQAQYAVDPLTTAVSILSDLAESSPAYEPDLASAVNNLATCYSELGRHEEALQHAQYAAELRERSAQENPRHLPKLAAALDNLGRRYAAVGRYTDALNATEESVRILSALSETQRHLRRDLAAGYNSVGICYDDLGRTEDALAAVISAAITFRALADEDPAAHSRDLALMLSNLALRHHNLGQAREALKAADEAVAIHRALAENNAAHYPDLVTMLTHREQLLDGADSVAGAGPGWTEVLAATPHPHDRAALQILRAERIAAGDLRAVAWLAEAVELAPAHPELTPGAFRCTRHHRAVDPPRWDAAWKAVSGKDIPERATIDLALIDAAQKWRETPTIEAERDYLSAHPHLVDAASDLAVDEMLSGLEADEATRYRILRGKAQTMGADQAYRPILLSQAFIAADPAAQRHLLHDHRDELSAPEVLQALTPSNGEFVTGEHLRAHGLVTLAAAPGGDQWIDDVFDAIDAPQRFPDVLHRIAVDSEVVDRLRGAATVAFAVAAGPEDQALAHIYGALSAAVDGDTDLIGHFTGLAVATASDQRTAWITLLAQIGITVPAALQVIQQLAQSGSA